MPTSALSQPACPRLLANHWLTTGIATLLLIGSAGAEAPPQKSKDGEPSMPTRAPYERTEVQKVPPKAPTQFNPDPGGGSGPTPGAAPVATPDLYTNDPIILPPLFGAEALPDDLKLPRRSVTGVQHINKVWHYSDYPLGREGLGLPPNSKAVPNRWFLNLPHWTRYRDPSIETAYQYETPSLWHPYRQSTLKGDVPIIGQDIFLNVTAKNFSLFEARKTPIPSGVSTATPGSTDFFGRNEQLFFSNDTSLAFDLFQGETAFKPVQWLLRVQGVYNNNTVRFRENNQIDPDPRGTTYREGSNPLNPSTIQAGTSGNFVGSVKPGDVFNYLAPEYRPSADGKGLVKVNPNNNTKVPGAQQFSSKRARADFSGSDYTVRNRDFFALQESFAEIHIADLSDNYDFVSSRFGIQPFVSDFRGFIFADTNLGARVFGNWNNNRLVYNLAYFNQREKDTYSDLNTFESRHQQLLIANVFRQDTLWKGYTSQFSFHANFDDGGTHYDKNGFLTRPAVLGDFGERGLDGHKVKSFYLGWAGDGHIGRYNITHAFYQVFGEDSHNGFAGRTVDINAQMAALELSYDRDWIRFKVSGFYASGDSDPTDSHANGFDSIQENPFFIGGPFSWYVHEGVNLGGTNVALKQRDSLIPNFRSSKTEGQSNFVNPGVAIVGVGTDLDVTPKLKSFINLNYIWFAETKPVEIALHTNKSRNDLGLDASIGFKYRPLLTDNIIVSAGIGFFVPGGGYRDIYRRSTERVPGIGPQDQEGHTDSFLYNGFLTVTLIY